MVVEGTSVIVCSSHTNIIFDSKLPTKRPRLDDDMQAQTLIPYGLLATFPIPLFYALSKCNYNINALDERSYSLFIEKMLLWKFRDEHKQVHPLLRFFNVNTPEYTEPFEFAQFKSVDQLVSTVRFMAFHDKRQWTQGLFFLFIF